MTKVIKNKMKHDLKNPKDPGSAWTHFIAMLATLLFSPVLLQKASQTGSRAFVISMAIFIYTMVGLYLASTCYHTFNLSPTINRRLKKWDHLMIFIMIAGSYTPISLIVVGGKKGFFLCLSVWIVAILGMIMKAFWIYCPKWFSSIIYVAMGWMCLPIVKTLYSKLSGKGFAWLLLGGVIYTLGGIIYAIKLPRFDAKHKNFGSHEIFHLFVMLGSFCHIVLMFRFLPPFV